MKAALALLGCCGLLTGCAVNPAGTSCDLGTALTVTPTSATADHAAEPPGNQVPFKSGLAPTAPPGCPLPAWVAIAYPAWSNPDPTDVSISSANDATNGTAVCKAATNGPVTLTATAEYGGKTPAAMVTLTCQ